MGHSNSIARSRFSSGTMAHWNIRWVPKQFLWTAMLCGPKARLGRAILSRAFGTARKGSTILMPAQVQPQEHIQILDAWRSPHRVLGIPTIPLAFYPVSMLMEHLANVMGMEWDNAPPIGWWASSQTTS